jgi:SAM-dependent methyltransferase
MEDTYSRFSSVVEHYLRYRPRYPHQLVEWLQAECDLSPTQVVADIGSGTGLLAALFLQHGHHVYGVEPNGEMRAAAAYLLRSYPLFTSIAATAEATTLANHSVHLIAVGQAFQWFTLEPTRQEFLRILIPSGWVVLVWNLQRNTGSPFAAAFEQFWHTYIDPRTPFRREGKRPDYIAEFFGAARVKETGLANSQVCDFDALKGRVLSASRAPQVGDLRYPAMLDELTTIFRHYQEGGTVTLAYDTRIVCGQLSA